MQLEKEIELKQKKKLELTLQALISRRLGRTSISLNKF
jgi:hypothetical protein